MRFKRHLFPAAILAVVALALVIAPEVLAQKNFGLGTAAAGTGIPTGTNIPAIIGNILRIALQFVGTLFLLLMVYAGFLWMTARGDEAKVKTAKQLISGAVIGLIIIASAYAITNLVLYAATSAGSGETEEGEEAPAEIEDGTVAEGGTCGEDADCTGALVCTETKCTLP